MNTMLEILEADLLELEGLKDITDNQERKQTLLSIAACYTTKEDTIYNSLQCINPRGDGFGASSPTYYDRDIKSLIRFLNMKRASELERLKYLELKIILEFIKIDAERKGDIATVTTIETTSPTEIVQDGWLDRFLKSNGYTVALDLYERTLKAGFSTVM